MFLGLLGPHRYSARLAVVVVALFTSVLMVTGGLTGVAAAEDEPAVAPTEQGLEAGDSDGDGDLDRPDTVSASVTARAMGEPVEDLSRRSETTRTLINPDGSLTDEQFAGPVRVQDPDDGTWQDIDYTLVEQGDGSFAPRASNVDVTVDGGSAKEATRLDLGDGRSIAVTWPEALPKPTIAGGVATYKVSETSDLLVSLTGDGVNARIRLNEAPAEDDPVFRLGLRAEGVEIVETDSAWV